MKKSAAIYRMVTPDHLCPWGIKARDLLQRNGYDVEDHLLETMDANEAYKKEHGYEETRRSSSRANTLAPTTTCQSFFEMIGMQ